MVTPLRRSRKGYGSRANQRKDRQKGRNNCSSIIQTRVAATSRIERGDVHTSSAPSCRSPFLASARSFPADEGEEGAPTIFFQPLPRESLDFEDYDGGGALADVIRNGGGSGEGSVDSEGRSATNATGGKSGSRRKPISSGPRTRDANEEDEDYKYGDDSDRVSDGYFATDESDSEAGGGCGRKRAGKSRSQNEAGKEPPKAKSEEEEGKASNMERNGDDDSFKYEKIPLRKAKTSIAVLATRRRRRRRHTVVPRRLPPSPQDGDDDVRGGWYSRVKGGSMSIIANVYDQPNLREKKDDEENDEVEDFDGPPKEEIDSDSSSDIDFGETSTGFEKEYGDNMEGDMLDQCQEILSRSNGRHCGSMAAPLAIETNDVVQSTVKRGCGKMKETVLAHPMGRSKLLDLTTKEREMDKNDEASKGCEDSDGKRAREERSLAEEEQEKEDVEEDVWANQSEEDDEGESSQEEGDDESSYMLSQKKGSIGQKKSTKKKKVSGIGTKDGQSARPIECAEDKLGRSKEKKRNPCDEGNKTFPVKSVFIPVMGTEQRGHKVSKEKTTRGIQGWLTKDVVKDGQGPKAAGERDTVKEAPEKVMVAESHQESNKRDRGKRNKRREPQSSAARSVFAAIVGLKKSCSEFISLSEDVNQGCSLRNEYLQKVAEQFRCLSEVKSSSLATDVDGEKLPFSVVFEEALGAYGPTKAEKVITVSMYLVLQSVSQNVSNATQSRRQMFLIDCLSFFAGTDTVPGIFRCLGSSGKEEGRDHFPCTFSLILSDADIVISLCQLVAGLAGPIPINADQDHIESRGVAGALAAACLHSVDMRSVIGLVHSPKSAPSLQEALVELAAKVHLLPMHPLVELALLFIVRLRQAAAAICTSSPDNERESENHGSDLIETNFLDSALLPPIRDRLLLLESSLITNSHKSGLRSSTFPVWARECFSQVQQNIDLSVASFKCNGIYRPKMNGDIGTRIAIIDFIDINATNVSFFAEPFGAKKMPFFNKTNSGQGKIHGFRFDALSPSVVYGNMHVPIQIDFRCLKKASNGHDFGKPIVYVGHEDSVITLDISQSAWTASNLPCLFQSDSTSRISLASSIVSVNKVINLEVSSNQDDIIETQRTSLKVYVKRDSFQRLLSVLKGRGFALMAIDDDDFLTVALRSDLEEVPPMQSKSPQKFHSDDGDMTPEIGVIESTNHSHMNFCTREVPDKLICALNANPNPTEDKKSLPSLPSKPNDHINQVAVSAVSVDGGSSYEKDSRHNFQPGHKECLSRSESKNLIQSHNSMEYPRKRKRNGELETNQKGIPNSTKDLSLVRSLAEDKRTTVEKFQKGGTSLLSPAKNQKRPRMQGDKKVAEVTPPPVNFIRYAAPGDHRQHCDAMVPSSIRRLQQLPILDVRSPASNCTSLRSISALCFAAASDECINGAPLSLPPSLRSPDAALKGEDTAEMILAMDGAIGNLADAMNTVVHLVNCIGGAKVATVSCDLMESLGWVQDMQKRTLSASQNWTTRREKIDENLQSLLIRTLDGSEVGPTKSPKNGIFTAT